MYHIIDSTLREGEQFVNAPFSRDQKLQIARGLDEFGVEYQELTSPMASPGSLDDLKAITGLGLRSRILTHIRCHKDDARVALDARARQRARYRRQEAGEPDRRDPQRGVAAQPLGRGRAGRSRAPRSQGGGCRGDRHAGFGREREHGRGRRGNLQTSGV